MEGHEIDNGLLDPKFYRGTGYRAAFTKLRDEVRSGGFGTNAMARNIGRSPDMRISARFSRTHRTSALVGIAEYPSHRNG